MVCRHLTSHVVHHHRNNRNKYHNNHPSGIRRLGRTGRLRCSNHSCGAQGLLVWLHSTGAARRIVGRSKALPARHLVCIHPIEDRLPIGIAIGNRHRQELEAFLLREGHLQRMAVKVPIQWTRTTIRDIEGRNLTPGGLRTGIRINRTAGPERRRIMEMARRVLINLCTVGRLLEVRLGRQETARRLGDLHPATWAPSAALPG